MNLKFTFSSGETTDPKPLPFSTAPTVPSGSSELYFDVTETDGTLTARGVSGDGVEYGAASREVAASGDSETLSRALRSVLSRVYAEVGDPVNRSLTALRLPAQLRATLVSAKFADASGERTSELLQLRSGIPADTAVTDLPTETSKH